MATTPETLDIVFSFDTTGSMSDLLEEVRSRVNTMIKRLRGDIPGIRIAILVHGDYCDKDVFYVTKTTNFSTSTEEICAFVTDVGSTGGGDNDECYEFVLKEVREKLNWSSSSKKVLVLIGDASPHEPSYPENKAQIDWRFETKLLGDMGVKIYGVQCGSGEDEGKFYKAISINTGGTYLQLPEFDLIYDLIMGICYHEHDEKMLQAFEEEVRVNAKQSGHSPPPEFNLFPTLRGETRPPTPPSPGSTITDASSVNSYLEKMKNLSFEEGVCVKAVDTGHSQPSVFKLLSTLKGDTTPPTLPSPGSTITDESSIFSYHESMKNRESHTDPMDSSSSSKGGDLEDLKLCPPKNGRKFTVSVEGNIGCGKTTFLEHFKHIPGIQVEREPVDLWKNVAGSNLLELMYQDASRWSFAFQSYVQLTLLNVHERNKKGCNLKIMERSIYSAKYCFVENLYKSNLMTDIDYCVITEWFNWILENCTPKIDLIVYLKARPETCQCRIQARNRNEEQSIPLDYLKALDVLHEEWLTEKKFPVPAPVIVVDTETDLINLTKKYEELKPQILCGVGL